MPLLTRNYIRVLKNLKDNNNCNIKATKAITELQKKKKKKKKFQQYNVGG